MEATIKAPISITRIGPLSDSNWQTRRSFLQNRLGIDFSVAVFTEKRAPGIDKVFFSVADIGRCTR